MWCRPCWLAGGHSVRTPMGEVDEATLSTILYGADQPVVLPGKAGTKERKVRFDGVIATIERAGQGRFRSTAPPMGSALPAQAAMPCLRGIPSATDRAPVQNRRRHAARCGGHGPGRLGHMGPCRRPPAWTSGKPPSAQEPLKEIAARLGFLLDMGLDYLTLDRPARSLSGGEAQRIRLATQIGSKLTGVLYILDEPSIGLHQRDNQRLIDSLKTLRDVGNTVIVVEHDEDMMRQADHLIDIGPGAGKHGGMVVARRPALANTWPRAA